jgi:hypothetical protein
MNDLPRPPGDQASIRGARKGSDGAVNVAGVALIDWV